MKAMILAAGLGTRLRPLTNDRPKALVEVAGQTMLEIALTRLLKFGVNEVVVNTHHYAEMVESYLAANQNFGIHIAISREETLLDTGGGLKHAAWFFLDHAGAGSLNVDEPFLLHNVDVLSDIDLGAMVRRHVQQDALATMAVQHRATSRYLLFDEDGLLCGRRAGLEGAPELVRDVHDFEPLAFAGIHVISPRVFVRMREEGAFSIISAYLHLAGSGERILAFNADPYQWRDLGTPESVLEASRDFPLRR